jgi:LysM repeat protein
MLSNNWIKVVLIGVIPVLFLGLAACSDVQSATQIAASQTIVLTPYQSPTPSETPEFEVQNLTEPTQSPSATPTPVVYEIEEGDTMLGIALQHGISLEELQAANPDVNPRLLVIGTELIIPLGEIIPLEQATATPIAIKISKTNCYPAPDGIWCFISIKNDRRRPLENVAAHVVVYENSGEFIVEGTAIAAVNRVPVGEEFPLDIFFQGRFPADFFTRAEIMSVQLVPQNDERYLNAWLEINDIEISDAGNQAEITGTIGLPVKSQPGNLAWILAVAYDESGNVVGIRKSEQFGLFEPGTNQDFRLEVFSLGGPINDVKAFVEVRP